MERSKLKKGKWGPFRIIMLFLLSVYALTIIFLVVWVLLSSFKSKMDFSDYPLAFPQKFYFENYANIFKELSVPVTIPGVGQRDILLPELFLYSLLYSVGCTAVSIIAKAMVAYVVAKYKFRLAPVLYTINIVVMIIPIVGRLPSELQLMRAIGFYHEGFFYGHGFHVAARYVQHCFLGVCGSRKNRRGVAFYHYVESYVPDGETGNTDPRPHEFYHVLERLERERDLYAELSHRRICAVYVPEQQHQFDQFRRRAVCALRLYGSHASDSHSVLYFQRPVVGGSKFRRN